MLHHLLKHRALNHHKACWCFAHFYETIFLDVHREFSGIGSHATINGIALVQGLKRLLGHALRQTLLRPSLVFQRIHACGNVVVGTQQTQSRIRSKADVRIDPEQMRPVWIFQKLRHTIVASTGHQAFALLQ